MILRGSGFCPGHITGFFSIHDSGKDLLRIGSRGAGVNISLGALCLAAVEPPGDTTEPMELKVNIKGGGSFESNEKLYRDVLTALLPDSGMGWKVSLRISLQLPVGQGFGMSGAGALASAISVWEAVYSNVPAWDRKLRFRAQQEKYFSMNTKQFRVKPLKRRLLSPMQLYMGEKKATVSVEGSGRASGMLEGSGSIRTPARWLENSKAEEGTMEISYSDCISAAHRAELLNKGGLGDVVAQARGGIEMRLAPGIPPFGEVHTIPVGLDDTPSVAFMTLGDPIDTGKILTDPLKRRRVNEAGEEALEKLLQKPSLRNLMKESYHFSSSARLQTLGVKGALLEVQDFAEASQVMLGNSVFAFVGGGLGAEQKKKVLDTWGKHGKVEVCDIDLLGARPIN